MDDLAKRRLEIRPARHANEAALVRFRDAEIRLTIAEHNLTDMIEEPHVAEATGIRDEASTAEIEASDAQNRTQATLNHALELYQRTAVTERRLWRKGHDLPLLLLPVRLETIFRDTDGGSELLIRVYPDDLHVDAHEPELTRAEREAGERYFNALEAAQADQTLRDTAWRALVRELGPARAAWVRQAFGESGPGDPPERAAAWTRAAHTTLLPDKFAFSAYNDAGDGELELVWRHEGAPIPDLLPVGMAPPESATRTRADDPLPWDDRSRWLVDFAEAEKVGMGLTVTLDSQNPAFDLLTCVGVITGDDAEETAARWQTALQAHRYGDGLAVLAPGTPTNNTPASRSGWHSQPDPPTADAVDEQVGRYDAASDQAAARAARAFGIDGAAVLASVENGLIRPATSFGRLEAEEIDAELDAKLRELVGAMHAGSSAWARYPEPRGPSHIPFNIEPDLSAARAHFLAHVSSRGSLPTLRIGRQPYGVLPAATLDLWRGADPDRDLVAHVASVLNAFEVRSSAAVRIGEGDDQDAVILDLLSRRPTAERIDAWAHADGVRSDVVLDPAGLKYFSPRPAVAGSVPADSQAVYLEPSDEFLARMQEEPTTPSPITLGEDVPASLHELFAAHALGGFDAIQDELRALYEGQQPFGPAPPDEQRESQLLGKLFEQFAKAGSLAGTNDTHLFYVLGLLFAWQRQEALDRVFKTLPRFPDMPPSAIADARRMLERLDSMMTIITQLEARAETDLPAIHRLLAEALAPLSHRIDAWVTSIAGARLSTIRAEHPTGLRIGAYGWLTGLSRGGEDASNGYIVTPSMHHAATAAVLRSGFLAHSDPRTLAVDLQSWRVRRAQEIVDGIRDGQQLGALLGYQFERGLHDAHLDGAIKSLRERYPLPDVVTPAAGDGSGRSERAARIVVDGLAVRADKASFAGAHPLFGDDPDAQKTATALVRDLDDTVDAVGDLLLAESVHHLISGSPLRAGLAVDTLGRADGVPDEFESVRTPRSASSLDCHVGVVGPPGGGGGAAGYADDRALARLEPAIESWCRGRLGPANAWKFGTVELAALGWSALDVVTAALPGDASPLVAALERQAGAALDDAGRARAAELALLCGQLRAALQAGTPLIGTHIDPSSHDGWVVADLPELRGRLAPWLDAVIAAVGELRGALTESEPPDRALAALVDLGVHTAAVAPAADVLARLDALDLAPLAAPPPGGDPGAGAWAQAAIGLVGEVAGAHMKVVPILSLAPAGPAPAGADADAVGDWLRRVRPLRPRTAALEDALVAADVIAGSGGGAFRVTQSPAGAAERWVANVTPVGPTPGATVRSTLVLHGDAPPQERVAGLILDSWTEAVPLPGGEDGPHEIAGMAFHYDRPGARAPQTLLLAVPPDRERGWRLEDVHGVVEDTLMLARIRGLDLRDIPDMRSLLPLPVQ
jgi:hypothetical protein